jgi:hypothetical protein
MTASIERELNEQEKVFAYLAGLATDPPFTGSIRMRPRYFSPAHAR